MTSTQIARVGFVTSERIRGHNGRKSDQADTQQDAEDERGRQNGPRPAGYAGEAVGHRGKQFTSMVSCALESEGNCKTSIPGSIPGGASNFTRSIHGTSVIVKSHD